MLTLSVPSSVRQLFFATGLTALFWIVGRVSTTALAGANVLVNLMLVAILPSLGLGMAAASLVGQALGRKDAVDAKRWGWEVVRVGLVILMGIGLPMVLIPEQLLSIFTQDTATIAMAELPLRIVGATIAVDGIAMVLQNAMLGAGDARRIMVVGITLQWVFFLPMAYLAGPVLGYGHLGIWAIQAAHRAIQAGVFAAMWHGGKWATAVRL